MELTAKAAPLERKLAQLAEHGEKLKATITDHETTVSSLEFDVTHLNDLVLERKSELSILATTISDANLTINTLEAKETGLNKRIVVLNQDVLALFDNEATINNNVKSLETQMTLAQAKVDELTELAEAKQSDLDTLDTEWRKLGVKNRVLIQDMAIKSAESERERSDLANRKVALDDREAVLRRREQKAQMQESTIQQNASLLEL